MAPRDRIPCFLIEPTGDVRVSLRRHAHGEDRCPVDVLHRASTTIGEEPEGRDSDYRHDDPRWPTACECGYRFAEDDHRFIAQDPIYRRTDTGERLVLDEAPAGAMWFADWYPEEWRGPDGHTLVVKTPGGDWIVDRPAADGKGWDRHGEPPRVTARPSIGFPDKSGGWRYHGWLTDGVLVEC